MVAPFEIEFSNVMEIRMGSPYNSCDIKFTGATNIEIPNVSWQDKYAWSSDFAKLVIVKWDFDNNIAGFHLFTIEIASGKTHESPKFLGLLNSLSIVDDKIHINKFLFNKEKSVTGALCCNEDEVYILSQ